MRSGRGVCGVGVGLSVTPSYEKYIYMDTSVIYGI